MFSRTSLRLKTTDIGIFYTWSLYVRSQTTGYILQNIILPTVFDAHQMQFLPQGSLRIVASRLLFIWDMTETVLTCKTYAFNLICLLQDHIDLCFARTYLLLCTKTNLIWFRICITHCLRLSYDFATINFWEQFIFLV